MNCRGCGQGIVYRRAEGQNNEWVHEEVVWDLWCEAVTEKRMDPAQIKTVNWSRHRKRNKKLWKRTRSRGGTIRVINDSEALALILEVENA
jgi:hypothetical protein